jgi:hypothetical protein
LKDIVTVVFVEVVDAFGEVVEPDGGSAAATTRLASDLLVGGAVSGADTVIAAWGLAVLADGKPNAGEAVWGRAGAITAVVCEPFLMSTSTVSGASARVPGVAVVAAGAVEGVGVNSVPAAVVGADADETVDELACGPPELLTAIWPGAFSRPR